MNDLVSVIVPVFNRSSTVGLALDSVLRQTYRLWEVVVVDDASTDDTTQIAKEYGRNDSRIHLIEHGQRKGAQAARNTGLLAARGKWMAFLDSDDEWLPDSLEVRLQQAAEKGLEAVHSDCYILNPDNSELILFCLPPMRGRIYKELLKTPGSMFQCLLVSKQALARIGPLDESILSFQEWDTAIRLAKYYEFGFVSKPTFIYDCRHGDTISGDLRRTAIGYEQVFTKHRWSIVRYCGPKALTSHYETAAGLYLEAKDEANARRCLLMAFLLWPFRPKRSFRDLRGGG